MPFTPFHMGPALAVKAISGRYFSVTMFGVTQIAIDLEPLMRLFRSDEILHGPSHSYMGATVIAGIVLLSSRPFCRAILRRSNQEFVSHDLSWLASPTEISWFSAASGTFFGAYSHVFLDSMFHFDISPFWPFSKADSLSCLISPDSIHQLCLLLAFIGVSAWLLQAWLHRGPSESA